MKTTLNIFLIHTRILFLTTLILSSCAINKNSNQRSDKWLVYEIELSGYGKAEQIILLQLKDHNSCFKLHWFIYQVNGANRLFSRVTFEDEIKVSKDEYLLPETITFNEVKIDSTKVLKLPLDQSPNFKFDNKQKKLTAFRQILNIKKELSNEELIELIELHKNWHGESIQLP